MQVIFKKSLPALLLFGAALASCTTVEEKYQNTEMLERPPTLIIDKQSENPNVVEENAQTEAEPGLGVKVTLSETGPLHLTIKQPFEQAWNTIASALKQQELEITDRNRDEGLFYIDYRPGGFFSNLLTSSLVGRKEANHILKLERKAADDTVVTATFITHDNSTANPDGYYEAPDDNSEALLQILYNTLRDDLKEE